MCKDNVVLEIGGERHRLVSCEVNSASAFVYDVCSVCSCREQCLSEKWSNICDRLGEELCRGQNKDFKKIFYFIKDNEDNEYYE